MKCPCGGGGEYEACCEPRHFGARPAETPEALMRSRYTAFVLEKSEYLAATQRAPFDPARLQPVKWLGLTVHEAAAAQVEFTARYLEGDRLCALHERSSFERVGGRWIYTTGTPELTATKVERNDRCPCGSGRKFKSCCAVG